MFKNAVTPPMLVRSGGQATGLAVVSCNSGFGDATWRQTYAVTMLSELVFRDCIVAALPQA